MTYLPWGRIAASAAIIDNYKILLLKRVETAKVFPSHWTFPSGGIEETDMSITAAVIREVEEETSLIFTPTTQLGFYETIVDDKRCLALVHLGTYAGNIKTQESEIQTYEWCTYAEAMQLPLAFAYKKVINDLYERGLVR